VNKNLIREKEMKITKEKIDPRTQTLPFDMIERFEGKCVIHTPAGFIVLPYEVFDLSKKRRRITKADLAPILKTRKDLRKAKINKVPDITIREFKSPREVVIPKYKKSQIRVKPRSKKYQSQMLSFGE